MNLPRFFAIILLLTATTHSDLSWAQTPQERAEELYKNGAESYFKGDFLTALSSFKQGHELDPNAMFLYNISLCYGKLENYDEALKNAEKAHKTGLPPEVNDKNLARVIAYHANLKSQQLATAPRSATQSVEAQVSDPTPMPPVKSSKPSWLGWTGVGVATAGTGMLVGAIVIDAGLDSDINAYDEAIARDDIRESARLKTDIDSQQLLGKVLLISGGALAATGIALFVYDLLDTETVIAPVVGDQTGVTLIRHF